MRKIVLTYGLIAGAILSAMMLLILPFQDQIGFENGAIIGYTTMVLAFLMVFFGVRSYRDNVAGGRVTFGRAFIVGLMITAVASVCYVATWQLVYYKLAPDFVEKYVAYADGTGEGVRRHRGAAGRATEGAGGVHRDVQEPAREHRAHLPRAVAGGTGVHARDRGADEPRQSPLETQRRESDDGTWMFGTATRSWLTSTSEPGDAPPPERRLPSAKAAWLRDAASYAASRR